MKCLKIKMTGDTASFRYPYYLVGTQPTYETPPPATIYGLTCAAVGEMIDRESFEFGYTFQYEKKFLDLEHTHIIKQATGYFNTLEGRFPKNVEGKVNPYYREILFKPTLTLYLSSLDLEEYFWEPRFPLSFGRSQDLLYIESIENIDLEKNNIAYLENTLLPWEYRPYTPKGISLRMPKYIDYELDRKATFENYIYLKSKVYDGLNPAEYFSVSSSLLYQTDDLRNYYVDTDTPLSHDCYMGVIFHGL